MTYTGNVTKGGPPDVRELPGITIWKMEVGDFENNAYLIRCNATGDGLLIDAAAEPDRLLELIGDRPLRAIVTTHRHQDHWMALKEVARATGAEVIAHPLDAPELPVPVTREVVHGDVITVGNASFEVIHLRGHTPGSIALLYEDRHLFTGDSLFPGGVGNTWGDREKFEQLFTDVVERVFDRLPDECWVYPGHGRDTTLGAERPHLPEWKARGW
ncbi:hydrolase [Thermobispora bispora]|jgi:glyoxylase-like metal-dependent hydrolase (beta-lactamase superfamily II)|uniref:Beta-lactamase domain protein n=1 Tax=Thermobispora bispora (strain ATCC 19993 / DSM 43833 / CBS 139.67 / JCM 10125 / KCTC 9307 / NBRC 14880 / R51) TaxID=469371 RepID=D6Y1V6_THEBD|nr:MBL fold metallo-hydrolase [Thermobispora bispora]ADG88712.1 beta-lactamase domain protein [Thermobispora bispora DSM 43833]MBO2474552.1 MBL fold metallo-hydrolase [Actinomycetales bacterium]MBX6168047.1 MBL fold metallo-hydrolase [Thermobispora bispora]QSI48490.1 MBL fold metallo-hydrolase [Thermobispora bispora]